MLLAEYKDYITAFLPAVIGVFGVYAGVRLNSKAEEKRLMNSTFFHLFSLWQVLLKQRVIASKQIEAFSSDKITAGLLGWLKTNDIELSEKDLDVCMRTVPVVAQGVMKAMLDKSITLDAATQAKMNVSVDELAKINPFLAVSLKVKFEATLQILHGDVIPDLPAELSSQIDMPLAQSVVRIEELLEELSDALEESIRVFIIKMNYPLIGIWRARKLAAIKAEFLDVDDYSKSVEEMFNTLLPKLLDQHKDRIIIPVPEVKPE